MPRIQWIRALLLAGLSSWSASVLASFPDKDVSVIVPYGAGGSTDVILRMVSQNMQKTLGKPLVVVNRTGAQATLGPALVAKAKPDGYTLGAVTYSAIAITPYLIKVPYTAEDFDYIGALARYQFGLAVRADAPYKTLEQFLQHAKASDKPIFFGAGGAPNNLAFFALGQASGAKFAEASYKGGAESVNALLGGQVEAVIQAPSEILPHVQSGRLRLLASASPTRWLESPDTPTLKESGYNVEIDSRVGLIVPKGTPLEVRRQLERAAQAAVEEAQLKAALRSLGVEAGWMSGEQFKQALQELSRSMPAQLKQAGMLR